MIAGKLTWQAPVDTWPDGERLSLLTGSLDELTYDTSKSMTWGAESQQALGAPMLSGLLPTCIPVSIWCLLYFSLNKLQFWGLELQTMNPSERCLLELEEVDLRAVFKKLSPSTSGAPAVGSWSGCPQAGRPERFDRCSQVPGSP